LRQIDQILFRGWDPLARGSTAGLTREAARYASWGSPELVVRRAGSGTAIRLSGTSVSEDDSIEAGETIPARKVTLQERVEKRLSARSRVFEAQALTAFREGRYQEACDQVMLAEGSAMNDLENRVYLRMFHVYTSIAAREYSQAINSLYWLLKQQSDEGRVACAKALNRFRDIQSFYGHAADYSLHTRDLELYLARRSGDMIALQAIWAWGAGDVTNAKWHAQRLIEAVEKRIAEQREAGRVATSAWLRFVDVIKEAEQQRASQSSNTIPQDPVPVEVLE